MRWLAIRFVGRRAIGELPRLFLLISGIGLGVSLFVAILYAAEASVAAFERGIGRFEGANRLEIRPHGTHLYERDLEAFARYLAADYELFPFLVVKALAVDRSGETFTLNLVGSHAVIDSRGSSEPSTGKLPLVLPPTLAERLGLSEGLDSAFEIGGREIGFSVTKVSDPGEVAIPSDSAITDLGLLQSETGMRGKLSYLGLLPRAKDEADVVSGALEETIRGKPFRLVGEADRRLAADRLSRAFRSNVLVLVALTLVVAGFTVFNASRMSVLNVTRELSILRTLGVHRLHCMLLLLCEAMAVGAIGSAVGLTLGRPISDLTAALFLETASGLYGTGRGFEALGVASHAHLFALAAAAGIGTCLAGAIVPAWRGSGESPGISARERAGVERSRPSRRDAFMAGAVFSCALLSCLAAWRSSDVSLAYIAAVAIVLGLVFAAPSATWLSITPLAGFLGRRFGASGLLAVANVSASSRSTSLAVAGNAIALSLLVAMGLMIGSFRQTLSRWVEHTFAADVFLKPVASGSDVAGVIPESVYERIVSLPEVRAVARYVSFDTAIAEEPVTIAGTDLLPGEASRVYHLIEGRIDAGALESGEAALLGETAMRKLGKRTGDNVSVAGQTFRVAGAFKDFSRERATILLSIGAFRRLFSSAGYHTLSVYLANGAGDLAALRSVAEPAGLAVTSNAEIKSLVFRIFERTFGVTRLMAIIVAAICAFGFLVSLSQSVWERRADIKTLVYIGASGSEINRSLILEAVLVSIPSAILGLLGGVALAAVLVYLVNPLSFGWTLTPSLSLYELAVPFALVLGANLVVGSAALWKLRRIVGEARVSYE